MCSRCRRPAILNTEGRIEYTDGPVHSPVCAGGCRFWWNTPVSTESSELRAEMLRNLHP